MYEKILSIISGKIKKKIFIFFTRVLQDMRPELVYGERQLCHKALLHKQNP